MATTRSHIHSSNIHLYITIPDLQPTFYSSAPTGQDAHTPASRAFLALLSLSNAAPKVSHIQDRQTAPDTIKPLRIQKGYVAFGDSYAASIGTGTTEGGGCRRGENSYPKQLAALPANDIDFQNLPCSGAVVGDILQGSPNSQIDAWINPQNADIGTLSIGGNDIGFF